MKLDYVDLVKAKALSQDSAWLYAEIVVMRGKAPYSHLERVMAHIHDTYGYASLERFELGATVEQRTECYRDCLIALITRDFKDLRGQPMPAVARESFAATINGESVTPAHAFERFTELAMNGATVNIQYNITINQKDK